MAEITAKMVNDLRAKTGQGMIECKRALQEVGGDMEKAIEYFRKKGVKASLGERTPTEGRVVGIGFLPFDVKLEQGPGARDWRHFYLAAEALVQGENPYTSGTGGYVYPPMIAILLAPMAMVGPKFAAWIWFIGIIAMTAVTCWYGGRYMLRRIGADTRTETVAAVALIGLLLTLDLYRRVLAAS